MASKRTKKKSARASQPRRGGPTAGRTDRRGKGRTRKSAKSSATSSSRGGRSSQKSKAQPGAKPGSKKVAKKKQPDDGKQRLQRVMAAAGVASRRECELIIQEGRVEVDGQVIVELGYKVDPEKQEIYVDAERIRIEPLQYFVLNKPPGVVSTMQDPSGRARVVDLIPTTQRVYNVGRLDRSSEGLILVTNDGALAHRLTHPRFGIEKKYHVQVDGQPTPAQLRQLRSGVYIAEGKVNASNIRYLKKAKSGCWLEIVLDEGRNREIRRMLAAIGHKVRVLRRVAIGPLRLAELPIGAHRPLTRQEIKSLQTATSSSKRKSGKKKKSASRELAPTSASKIRSAKKKSTKKRVTRKKTSAPRDKNRSAKTRRRR